MFLLGIFDFGRAYMIQQNLVAACREGGRLAIAARPVTSADVDARVRDFLVGTDLATTATVTVSAEPSTVLSGNTIQVDASVPFELTAIAYSFTIRGRAKMMKE